MLCRKTTGSRSSSHQTITITGQKFQVTTECELLSLKIIKFSRKRRVGPKDRCPQADKTHILLITQQRASEGFLKADLKCSVAKYVYELCMRKIPSVHVFMTEKDELSSGYKLTRDKQAPLSKETRYLKVLYSLSVIKYLRNVFLRVRSCLEVFSAKLLQFTSVVHCTSSGYLTFGMKMRYE